MLNDEKLKNPSDCGQLIECKNEIRKANESLEKLETLQRNSECYIYEYFEDIKRQVDIRREDLKDKIDKYSDEVIQTIEKAQLDCIKLSKEANEISVNIEESKKELDDFIQQFDTLEADHIKFESIKQGVTCINENFQSILAEYNDSLLDYNEYFFNFEEISIEEVFGSLVNAEKFDSVILNTNVLHSKLNQICQFPKTQQWELKYRATRDGFSAQNFHFSCDRIPNTLTLIKTTNGNVFGGFAEKEWSSKNVFVTDRNSFIFSLINKENKPFKANCSNKGKNAICCCSNNGPVFGYNSKKGFDIYISNNSNTSQFSNSFFGYTYPHPDFQPGSDRALSILAGSKSFQTVEIEVFTKN